MEQIRQHLNEKKIFEFRDGGDFDIFRFINALNEYVQFDVKSLIPQFVNQPVGYVESMFGLLVDMVQNYYGCMIYGCGIPKVRLLGSKEDWVATSRIKLDISL